MPRRYWLIYPVEESYWLIYTRGGDLSLAVFLQVCLLHEYVQVSLKTQPVCKLTELEHAATLLADIIYFRHPIG
jgi:hypothetical protein